MGSSYNENVKLMMSFVSIRTLGHLSLRILTLMLIAAFVKCTSIMSIQNSMTSTVLSPTLVLSLPFASKRPLRTPPSSVAWTLGFLCASTSKPDSLLPTSRAAMRSWPLTPSSLTLLPMMMVSLDMEVLPWFNCTLVSRV